MLASLIMHFPEMESASVCELARKHLLNSAVDAKLTTADQSRAFVLKYAALVAPKFRADNLPLMKGGGGEGKAHAEPVVQAVQSLSDAAAIQHRDVRLDLAASQKALATMAASVASLARELGDIKTALSALRGQS